MSSIIKGIDGFNSSNVATDTELNAGLDLKVALSSFTGTNVSLSGNGYQKLPGGLILQWGFSTTSLSGDTLITFPIAFPNSILSYTTGQAGGNITTSFSPVSPYKTQSNVSTYNGATGARTGGGLQWFAIGY